MRLVLATMIAVATFAGPVRAQSPEAAQMLALTCAACHGPDGVGAGGIPALRGHTKDYLLTMLKAFRAGERPSTVMGRLAKGYGDAEIDALAVYFAALK